MLKYAKYGILVLLFLAIAASQAAADGLVNINVINTDVRDVLTALASSGGVSIVADDSVTGKITIRLRDIPFDTALDIITKTKGFSYQKIGNIIVVATPERMSKSFGVMQVFKLNYAKVEEVVKSLAAIVPAERLKVDVASNSIVFDGSPEEAAMLKQALADLDIPYRQISLEAKVVELDKSATKDLGIDWQWSTLPADVQESTTTTAIGASTTNSTQVTRPYPGAIAFGNNPQGMPYEFDFQATLSALISKGNAKILSKPNITTIDGQEAQIMVGDKIPALNEQTDSTGKTTTTVTYVDAGIKLVYTPRINADGMITAKVHTEVSTPTLVPEMKAYSISTRSADTNVRMHDGETIAIGGLIGSSDSGGNNIIPGLGDLPILGALFRSTHTVKQETEVVIFLTAHIVKDEEQAKQ